MSPLQKKVCLVGVPAVGKTSLVRRFVEGLFSEDYLTTIGVKIDRTTVDVDGREVRLIVWDVAGDDAMTPIRETYLRGAHGILFVADGTRAITLERALALRDRFASSLGPVPCVLAVNKADLTDDWETDADRLDAVRDSGVPVLVTSARTGDGVAEAFEALARRALEA